MDVQIEWNALFLAMQAFSIREGITQERTSPQPVAGQPIPKQTGLALERVVPVGGCCWSLLLCGNPGETLPISKAAIDTYMTSIDLNRGVPLRFVCDGPQGREEYALIPPLVFIPPAEALQRFWSLFDKPVRMDEPTVLVFVQRRA